MNFMLTLYVPIYQLQLRQYDIVEVTQAALWPLRHNQYNFILRSKYDLEGI